MKKIIIVLMLSLIWIGTPWAAEFGEVDIHGFISQGYLQSNTNNYLANTEDGTFEFNEVGLNFTTWLTSELRAGIQLFSRDLGEVGNDEITVDWAYGDYRWKEWLGLRVGILKIAHGLYNESRDIDALRTCILLPQSIYVENLREPLVRMKGASIYGDVALGKGGTLVYTAQYGTQSISNSSGVARGSEGSALNGGIYIDVDSFDVEQKYVANLQWHTPLEGLRFGASVNSTKMQTYYHLSKDWSMFGVTLANAGDTGYTDFPTMLQFVYSAEYMRDNLLVAIEYLRQNQTKIDHLSSSVPQPIPMGPGRSVNVNAPMENHMDSEGYYGSISYRLTEWFELGSYYSAFYSYRNEREMDFGNYLKDWAVSTRFDLNTFWTFKLEGHLMRGTAFLNNLDNMNEDGEIEKDPNWFLFAAKITYTF